MPTTGIPSTSYGRWKVIRERQTGLTTTTVYYVQCGTDETDRLEVGNGKTGEQQARTLAATLERAGAHDIDILPPELGPTGYADADEWEQWTAKQQAVPIAVAGAGKAPIAGWLKVVHRESESWIANRLDVSEQTIRQYLSDLREGRR